LGATVLGTVTIPSTGGWDIWATVPLTNVSLTAGAQTLRIQSITAATCNFNWMDFVLTSAPTPPPTANAGTAQVITLPTTQATLSGGGTAGNGGSLTYAWSQVGGTAATIASPNTASTNITGLTTTGVRTFRLTVTQSDNQTATSDVTVTVNPASGPAGKTIPGKIEAEAWDAKSGGMYPLPTNDAGGGQHVVGIANGNWLDYNVTVTQSGIYTVGFRVATTQPNTQFQVKLGATVLGTVTIPSTGGWDIWATVPLTNVSLTAGAQTLRIQSITAATCNFNWMDFALVTPAILKPAIANANLVIATDKVLPETTAIKIFPNPVADKFVLQTDSEYEGTMKIQVLDQAGNTVKQVQVMKNKGLTRMSILADGISAGIYIIRVQTGDRVSDVKMIKL
jgi:endoglucanase